MNAKWIKLVISNIRNNKGLLISILQDNGTLGIEEKNDKLISYFPEEHINNMQKLASTLKSKHPEIVVTIDKLENQDWHLNWQDQFEKVEVTDKISIIPSWQKEPTSSSQYNIFIKPGMAFGTGAHETTQLALNFLEKYIQKGDRILDAGCGNGILTIASIMFGAEFVEARDITNSIRENFYDQMKLNNISSGYNLEIKDVTQKSKFPYDLIISNIQRKINTKLLKKITTSDFDGIIIFTGLLRKEENQFDQEINKTGKEIIEKKFKDSWLAYVVK